MQWLIDNAATVVISAGLLIWFFLIIRRMVKNKRVGQSATGCAGCAGCSGKHSCASAKASKEHA